MSSELKPCPFCGSAAIVWMQAGHAHYLECSHCGGRIRPHIDKAKAIEAWNHRADDHYRVKPMASLPKGAMMKTLDETIKNLEDATEHLSSMLISIATWNDALNYLKAYRDNRDDLTALRAYWAEQQANPPLTWDELKAMEGKPVWVEYLRDGAAYDAEWCIVKDIDDDILHDTEGYGYGRANKYGDGYGVGWQAYRKERE